MLSSTVGFALSDRVLAQADGSSAAVPQATEQPNDESSDSESSSESADVGSVPSKEDAQKLRETHRQRAIEQEAENEKLRKSALAGLLILSLICIVFLMLIILVALWARRIRMLTRQPLPEQHPGDPLWYLRKGKGSDSSDIAEVMDRGSSHGES